ncbi:hypothetical protein [Lacicoccus qingdaonensis]|uniref:DUF5067 domain-containing protein n=1 Tax=Lacicoccus qingdaonensis TaxID=576118 RepID=A0A1G9JKZ2_9BACL|nr:hypothetical protein [Salinicoccus qingdaonensis]SDL38290.1 hypothetical protein SAMN05216216_1581 [Salinicoccus qingdaonensis]
MNFSLRILFTIPILFVLAACSNDEGGEDSLLNDAEIEEGYYINYNGGKSDNEEMRTSDFMEYDAGTDYSLTRPAYVSYYNEEEFIQTNLYVDNMPVLIEEVPEATHVKLSFNQNNEDAIVFTDEVLDGAESERESVPEDEAEAEAAGQDGSDSGSDDGEEADEDTSSEASVFDSVEGEIVLDTSEFTDKDLFMYQGVNEEGAFTAMDNLATTRGIPYDSDLEYAVNQTVDIAYYNDSEFLEIHPAGEEDYIENVPDANYINITYNLDDMNDLLLKEEN